MKFLTTVLSVLCTLYVYAQPTGSYIILKGHIANNTDSAMETGTNGYISSEFFSTLIDKKGNFLQKIKVETDPQIVFFQLGDGLQLSFEANDTIELNWDARDVKNTIKVKSPVAERQLELQTQITEQQKYIPAFIEMLQSFSKEKLSDSVKAARINELYNKEVRAVLEAGVFHNTEKYIMDIYFRYLDQMWDNNLLPAYDLTLSNPHPNSESIFFFKMSGITHQKLYQIESEEFFKHSAGYRDFLYNYIRFYNPMKSTTLIGNNEEENNKKQLPFTPTWDEYYAGLRSLRIKEIRDWFITKCITDAFTSYTYEEVNAVYKDFMTKDPTPFYAEILKDTYAKLQSLRPGVPAPLFTLKDQRGKPVSLSDFRGKVVLLDFWGVHCGPCIYDIKNHLPALHEKYRDKDIVFVNICVDVQEKEWKNNLDSLHLSGINLLASASIEDPACKAYNINGIPHYVLIGKDGRIINNNSLSPRAGTSLDEELGHSLK